MRNEDLQDEELPHKEEELSHQALIPNVRVEI